MRLPDQFLCRNPSSRLPTIVSRYTKRMWNNLTAMQYVIRAVAANRRVEAFLRLALNVHRANVYHENYVWFPEPDWKRWR